MRVSPITYYRFRNFSYFTLLFFPTLQDHACERVRSWVVRFLGRDLGGGAGASTEAVGEAGLKAGPAAESASPAGPGVSPDEDQPRTAARPLAVEGRGRPEAQPQAVDPEP